MELVIRKRDKIFTIVVVVILALYGYYAFLRLLCKVTLWFGQCLDKIRLRPTLCFVQISI